MWSGDSESPDKLLLFNIKKVKELQVISIKYTYILQGIWLFMLTLCMLGNFACFLSSQDFVLKINFFKKIFQE